MPRPKTRTKRGSSRAKRPTYEEDSFSDEEQENLQGNLSNLLVYAFALACPSSTKRGRRTKKATPAKKRKSTCEGNCSCQCSTSTVQKRARKSSAKAKNGTSVASTSKHQGKGVVVLESEDENVEANLTESLENAIKGKVDNFFKTFESDDDDDLDKATEKKQSEQQDIVASSSRKPKSFYMVLSDSEDDVSPSTISNSVPDQSKSASETVTTALLKPTPIETPIPATSQKDHLASTSENVSVGKIEDLFAYVDAILNESNETIDLTDSKIETQAPLNLDDLKKKTDEILKDVEASIKDLQPKEAVKEAPSCPVCLEVLGGSMQAVATLCGHMFCKCCLEKVIKSTKKCPTCRKNLSKAKYHPIYI